jgi:hypothetical protein
VVINFQVGIILCYEHLVVDIAVIVEGLYTALAVLLGLIIFLVADLAVPIDIGFFLIANLVC